LLASSPATALKLEPAETSPKPAAPAQTMAAKANILVIISQSEQVGTAESRQRQNLCKTRQTPKTHQTHKTPN